MGKKLLTLARVALSFSSNHKLAPTRLALSRPPKWVSIQINNSVGQTKLQWRGWSYAASVPSDKPNAQKGRKRVSKDERRAMVESFVKKYRELNAGKFPTVSYTKKQVGGCYYVVRKIIQELEYKSEKKSLNSGNKNLMEKELFDESKTLTEVVMVSSGKTKMAIDSSVRNDLQLVCGEETGYAGDKHFEEQREPWASSPERNPCKEDVTTVTTGNHFVAVESEPCQSSLQLNDVKTEEAESSYIDSNAIDLEGTAAAFGEKSRSSQGKCQRHDSEFVSMDNCLIMEENSIEKARYERREQSALKDLPEEPSQSSNQILNDFKTEEVESSCSHFIAPESELLKEGIENVAAFISEKSGISQSKAESHGSGFVDMYQVVDRKGTEKAAYERREQSALKDHSKEPFQSLDQNLNHFKTEEAESSSYFMAPESELLKEGIENIAASSSEKSGSSHNKAEIYDSVFSDMENYQVVDAKGIEKAGYERKEQSALEDLPVTNDPNHKMEQYQAPFGLDESNTDNTSKETSTTEVSKKSTFWENIKSFADGIMNMWRKL